jgi:hypothetical protein
VQLAIEAFFDHDHAEGNGFIFVGEAGSDHLRRGDEAGVAVPPAPEPARRCVLYCLRVWVYMYIHHTYLYYIHVYMCVCVCVCVCVLYKYVYIYI